MRYFDINMPLVLYIDGLVQYWSNPIANAREILQSCTKPSIWTIIIMMRWYHTTINRLISTTAIPITSSVVVMLDEGHIFKAESISAISPASKPEDEY